MGADADPLKVPSVQLKAHSSRCEDLCHSNFVKMRSRPPKPHKHLVVPKRKKKRSKVIRNLLNLDFDRMQTSVTRFC